MKIKKYIVFIFCIMSLFFCSTVYAETITCDYGERKILFYTEHYSDSDYSNDYDVYNSKGNKIREQISNIKEMRPTSYHECPERIVIGQDTITMYSNSNGSGYKLGKVNCGNIG